MLPNWAWLLVLLVAAPLLITVLFWKEWSVYALIVATVIGLAVLAKIYRHAQTQKQRKELDRMAEETCDLTSLVTEAQKMDRLIEVWEQEQLL